MNIYDWVADFNNFFWPPGGRRGTGTGETGRKACKSHSDVAVVFEFASLAEGGESFEDFFDSFGSLAVFAAERFGDVLGGGAGREVGKGGVDGAGLFGEGFGPC